MEDKEARVILNAFCECEFTHCRNCAIHKSGVTMNNTCQNVVRDAVRVVLKIESDSTSDRV